MQKTKALAFSALIFLLLIAAVQPAAASDWVEVVEDVDGLVWSIDLDSIQDQSYSSSMVLVWVKIEYPDKSYAMYLLEFDFSDRTHMQLARHEYDPNGSITESDTTHSEWWHIVPDSTGESVYFYLKDYLNR